MLLRKIALGLFLGLWATSAAAQGRDQPPPHAVPPSMDDRERAEIIAEANALIERSALAVEKMRREAEVEDLLREARGIVVFPHLLQGGIIVGGRGGEGLLLLRTDGHWSNPVFLEHGAVTIGAQAGGATGPAVLLLRSERAAEAFADAGEEVTIGASAGLSIFGYATATRAETREGDAVLWSGAEGAFAGATVGLSDVAPAEDLNRAYHGEGVATREVLSQTQGTPMAERLKKALSK